MDQFSEMIAPDIAVYNHRDCMICLSEILKECNNETGQVFINKWSL